MSGSGGGGSSTGGGGGARFTDCLDIMAQTILNSPVPGVINALTPRDILSVVIAEDNGRKRVLAVYNGEVAGSITFSQLAQLMKCITDGYEFVAIVISVKGGSCVVEIRPKSEL